MSLLHGTEEVRALHASTCYGMERYRNGALDEPYSCTDGRIYRHNGSGGCQICGLDGFPNYCSGPGPLVPVINGHIRQRAKIFRTGMYLKPSFEIHPGPE